MSKVSDELRRNFKKFDDIRDAGLTTPEDVKRFDDILYGEDPNWQVLDVYRPKKEEGLLPVIVSVHGGGWVYGDKERYQYYCMSLAQRGFAVVNFTYRLAPEFKFPASFEDVNLVFQWVLNHAEEYGFDRDNIFAVGDSAGAHMLGLYSAICTNPEYAAGYEFSVPDGFAPKAIALNCGKYHMLSSQKKDVESEDPQSEELIKDLLPEEGTMEELKKISVDEHVTEDFPPVFLMTCNGDFLITEAMVMIERLMEKKVPFEFHFYGDKNKMLGHVFHVDLRSEEGRICNDEDCDYFRKFM